MFCSDYELRIRNVRHIFFRIYLASVLLVIFASDSAHSGMVLCSVLVIGLGMQCQTMYNPMGP